MSFAQFFLLYSIFFFCLFFYKTIKGLRGSVEDVILPNFWNGFTNNLSNIQALMCFKQIPICFLNSVSLWLSSFITFKRCIRHVLKWGNLPMFMMIACQKYNLLKTGVILKFSCQYCRTASVVVVTSWSSSFTLVRDFCSYLFLSMMPNHANNVLLQLGPADCRHNNTWSMTSIRLNLQIRSVLNVHCELGAQESVLFII